MARRRRIDIEGGIHHVMNRGVARRPVFFSDRDRLEFGRRLEHIHDELDVRILAYCLMGNHYHLLLRTPIGGLSRAMQHLASVYTRHTNDRIGTDGPLFRGRFHSILVTTDAYLTWATRYIHRNPLDLPGVSSPREYRWSSYRAYLGLRPTPAFLDTGPVLEQFGGCSDRLAAFTDDPSAAYGWDGDDALRTLVESVIARDDLAHGQGEAPAPWRSRAVLTLLGDVAPEPGVRAMAVAANDFPSDGARRMALSRARRRFATDPALARILATVLADLGVSRRGSDTLRYAKSPVRSGGPA